MPASPPRPHAALTALTVRPVRYDDADTIGELLGRAYAQYESTFPWPELWSEYLDEITDVRGRWGRSVLLVAECDSRIAGSVDYYPPYAGGYRLPPETLDWLEPSHRGRVELPPGWACMRSFAVEPAARHKGVGRALLDHVVGRAVADQATHVFLHSLPIMAAAMRLYEEAGFKRYPERDLQLRGNRPDQLLALLKPVALA